MLENVTEHKMYLLILSANLCETFLIVRIVQRDTGPYVKYLLFLSYFNETCIFSTYCRKILKKLRENPFNGSRVVPCGLTERHNEANNRIS